MRDSLESIDNYYRLRIAFKMISGTFSLSDIEKFKKVAHNLIALKSYDSNFELERLNDFIDELECLEEDFENILKQRKEKAEYIAALKLKQNKTSKDSLAREEIIKRIMASDMFCLDKDNLIIVIDKKDLVGLSGLFERLALMASIFCTNNFKDASKMFGISKRGFRFARRRQKL